MVTINIKKAEILYAINEKEDTITDKETKWMRILWTNIYTNTLENRLNGQVTRKIQCLKTQSSAIAQRVLSYFKILCT